MARRGLKNSQLFWLTALIPLFGPLIYLCASTSISSWCRNTQHFSTSLKLEARTDKIMGRKIAWLLWADLLPMSCCWLLLHLQETLTLLKNLLTGQWADINPIILSSFALALASGPNLQLCFVH